MSESPDKVAALADVIRALDRLGATYAVVGGVAVGIRSGVPRATIDTDIAVRSTVERVGTARRGERWSSRSSRIAASRRGSEHRSPRGCRAVPAAGQRLSSRFRGSEQVTELPGPAVATIDRGPEPSGERASAPPPSAPHNYAPRRISANTGAYDGRAKSRGARWERVERVARSPRLPHWPREVVPLQRQRLSNESLGVGALVKTGRREARGAGSRRP